MNFKIDENLPIEAAELLRQADHDALTVQDQDLCGSSDTEIARACQSEHRIIVILDLDFSDIRTYPPKQFYGLIVIRAKSEDKLHVLEIVKRIIPLVSGESIEGFLWIVEENRIRVRG